jgi:hypothetical protein
MTLHRKELLLRSPKKRNPDDVTQRTTSRVRKNMAESSREGYGSKRDDLPVVMMMMIWNY